MDHNQLLEHLSLLIAQQSRAIDAQLRFMELQNKALHQAHNPLVTYSGGKIEPIFN